jgi:hypothetical protein
MIIEKTQDIPQPQTEADVAGHILPAVKRAAHAETNLREVSGMMKAVEGASRRFI